MPTPKELENKIQKLAKEISADYDRKKAIKQSGKKK